MNFETETWNERKRFKNVYACRGYKRKLVKKFLQAVSLTFAWTNDDETWTINEMSFRWKTEMIKRDNEQWK